MEILKVKVLNNGEKLEITFRNGKEKPHTCIFRAEYFGFFPQEVVSNPKSVARSIITVDQGE